MVSCSFVHFCRQYMASEAVLKSSLVEDVREAMMSEQDSANKRRLTLVELLT